MKTTSNLKPGYTKAVSTPYQRRTNAVSSPFLRIEENTIQTFRQQAKNTLQKIIYYNYDVFIVLLKVWLIVVKFLKDILCYAYS